MYSKSRRKGSMWHYLVISILFLFGSTLVSCKHQSEAEAEKLTIEEAWTLLPDEPTSPPFVESTGEKAEDTVINNGGTVLLNDDTTYFYAPNDNAEYSDLEWAIYSMKEKDTNKNKVAETHLREKFYIVDNSIFVSDYTQEGSVILKIDLKTGEAESLCKGTLDYINTQNKELYFTVDNYDLPDEENGIYKMNMDNGETKKLCQKGYYFIEEVEGLVYLGAPHGDNSNDAVLASVNSDGTELKTIGRIPAFTMEGDYSEYEYVVDFGLCEDWLILSVGSYQGSGGFFYGGLVRMKKDGQQMERFYPSSIDNFEIIDGWIYFNEWNETLAGIGKTGCYRIRPNLDEKEALGDIIPTMYSYSEDGYLYYQYNSINEAEEYHIVDLRQCTPDGRNIVTLFNGNTAPQYEDSNYTSYANIETAGEYTYFNVIVSGYYAPSDSWRGHTCYGAYYRVHKDGSGLELIYEDKTMKCPTLVGHKTYTEYYNDRFEFSIEYPSTFVTTMFPANGDGIMLESSDGSTELTVSGINNVMDSTVESCFEDFISNHEDIAFKQQKDNWFVASWIEGDRILYMKKVVGTGSINTFIIQYPLEEKEYYDQVVNKLLESFETPGILESHVMNLEEEVYDYEKVRDLFISRFLVESPDKDDLTYALKSDLSDFSYKVFVDRFDEGIDMYVIRLSRTTDTAQNYFYYNPETDKFYEDGADLEEITSDDSIFFWSPF